MNSKKYEKEKEINEKCQNFGKLFKFYTETWPCEIEKSSFQF